MTFVSNSMANQTWLNSLCSLTITLHIVNLFKFTTGHEVILPYTQIDTQEEATLQEQTANKATIYHFRDHLFRIRKSSKKERKSDSLFYSLHAPQGGVTSNP